MEYLFVAADRSEPTRSWLDHLPQSANSNRPLSRELFIRGLDGSSPDVAEPWRPTHLRIVSDNSRTESANHMNVDDLRAVQKPLKDRYSTDPESAVITLKAEGDASGDGVSCKIDTGKALVEAGLHPATGGNGQFACSGDMLLEALAACAGVTLKAVATAIEFDLGEARIRVEGDLDFRGTLGVAKDAQVGFSDIRLMFDLQTDEPQDKIDTLIKLTERYCVVLQTLVSGIKPEVVVTRLAAA